MVTSPLAVAHLYSMPAWAMGATTTRRTRPLLSGWRMAILRWLLQRNPHHRHQRDQYRLTGIVAADGEFVVVQGQDVGGIGDRFLDHGQRAVFVGPAPERWRLFVGGHQQRPV